VSELNKIEAKIKKALKKQGTYSPSLDLLITTLAETYLLKMKAYKSSLDGNSSVDEISREGNITRKVNPDYRVFSDLVAKITPLFDRLSMTVPTQTTDENDPLQDLTDAVTEAKKAKK